MLKPNNCGPQPHPSLQCGRSAVPQRARKMCQRSASRAAFGKPLAEQGSVREEAVGQMDREHFAF